jgi:hypothetical protein
MANGIEERPGRETRLVVLVVAVSVAVLMLLARFRFPPANLTTVAPTPGPFAGLAARATFDDMAATIAALMTKITPGLAVVPLVPVPTDPPVPVKPSAKAPAPPALPPAPPVVPSIFAVAVRVRPDVGVVAMPAGMQLATEPGVAGGPELIALETARGVASLRLPPPSDTSPAVPDAVDRFSGFAYVAVVTATANGPTLRPVFIGRVDHSPDAAWGAPTVQIGRDSGVPSGALIYALDGRFIGLAIERTGGISIVPAPTLDSVFAAAASGSGGAAR